MLSHMPLVSRSNPCTNVDPADRVTLDEPINMAFLVVLEWMTPAEQVAFILHDVFGGPFTEVAEIVGRTPAACRQLASSTRRTFARRRLPRRRQYSRPDVGDGGDSLLERLDGARVSAAHDGWRPKSGVNRWAWFRASWSGYSMVLTLCG
jgi:hypothetical protein